jgi:hypothetical protein
MAGYVPSVDPNTPPPSQSDPTWRNEQADADRFEHLLSVAQATVAKDKTAIQNLQTQLNQHTLSNPKNWASYTQNPQAWDQQQQNLQTALHKEKVKLASDQEQLQRAQQNAAFYQNKADVRAAADNIGYDKAQVVYWQNQTLTGGGVDAQMSNVAHQDVAQAQLQYDTLILDPSTDPNIDSFQLQSARNDLNAEKQALARLEQQPTEYDRAVWYFEYYGHQPADVAKLDAANLQVAIEQGLLKP